MIDELTVVRVLWRAHDRRIGHDSCILSGGGGTCSGGHDHAGKGR